MDQNTYIFKNIKKYNIIITILSTDIYRTTSTIIIRI